MLSARRILIATVLVARAYCISLSVPGHCHRGRDPDPNPGRDPIRCPQNLNRDRRRDQGHVLDLEAGRQNRGQDRDLRPGHHLDQDPQLQCPGHRLLGVLLQQEVQGLVQTQNEDGFSTKTEEHILLRHSHGNNREKVKARVTAILRLQL